MARIVLHARRRVEDHEGTVQWTRVGPVVDVARHQTLSRRTRRVGRHPARSERRKRVVRAPRDSGVSGARTSWVMDQVLADYYRADR